MLDLSFLRLALSFHGRPRNELQAFNQAFDTLFLVLTEESARVFVLGYHSAQIVTQEFKHAVLAKNKLKCEQAGQIDFKELKGSAPANRKPAAPKAVNMMC